LQTDTNIEVLLAARAAAYRILQNLLGNEPSIEALEQLLSHTSREILNLFASNGDDLQVALDALFSATEAGLKDKDIFVDRLTNNFTRLFVGPGKSEAEPWESLHVSKENVLFQPLTLDVRRAYVAQGLIPQGYPHVADDHIALELDFMTQLAEKMVNAWQADDWEKVRNSGNASKEFLDTHLLTWTPSFVKGLAQARHAQFYNEVGQVLEAFLPIDRSALDEVEVLLGSS
jgi:TorA maturation chaperone TorD